MAECCDAARDEADLLLLAKAQRFISLILLMPTFFIFHYF